MTEVLDDLGLEYEYGRHLTPGKQKDIYVCETCDLRLEFPHTEDDFGGGFSTYCPQGHGAMNFVETIRSI